MPDLKIYLRHESVLPVMSILHGVIVARKITRASALD